MSRGKHLTWNDRLLIERYQKRGVSVAQIARNLRVTRQAIYCELKRGAYEWLDGETWETHIRYSPDIAQRRHDELNKNHGPQLKIGSDRKLANYIESKIINEHYSPQAVLHDIKQSGMNFSTTICKTTLYSYIKKGVFLNLTMKECPNKGQYRKRQYTHIKSSRATAGTSIEQRPDISARTEFGHWEMDTVIGKQRTKPILLVLSERKTRYELIYKLPDKTAQSVVDVLNKLERTYGKKFPNVFKTITVDNGCEFANARGMERSVWGKSNRTKLYYCHPYSAFERGLNENTNRIIRRFCPKGTDFRRTPPGYIRAVQTWINNYPRTVLGGLSASKLFQDEMNKLSIA